MGLEERKQIILKGNIVKDMSFEDVLNQFSNLIHKCCKKYYHNLNELGETWETIESQAHFSLFKAYRNYDIDKGYQLFALAERSILNDFQILYRKLTKVSSDIRLLDSVDRGVYEDNEGNEVTLLDIIGSSRSTENEAINNIIRDRINEICYKRYKINGVDAISALTGNKTHKELATKYDISRSQITKKLLALRQDLKEELSIEYKKINIDSKIIKESVVMTRTPKTSKLKMQQMILEGEYGLYNICESGVVTQFPDNIIDEIKDKELTFSNIDDLTKYKDEIFLKLNSFFTEVNDCLNTKQSLT